MTKTSANVGRQSIAEPTVPQLNRLQFPRPTIATAARSCSHAPSTRREVHWGHPCAPRQRLQSRSVRCGDTLQFLGASHDSADRQYVCLRTENRETTLAACG